MSTVFSTTGPPVTRLRQWSWLFILLTAFGGLWYPKLGLLLIPVMLALMALGLLKGKYWCGAICPHGSLFDYLLMPISRKREIPLVLKSRVVQGLALVGFACMLVRRLIRVTGFFGTLAFWDQLGFVFVVNYLVVTMAGSLLAVLISPRAWCTVCPMGIMQVLLYRLGRILGINSSTNKLVTVTSPERCRKCAKCARVCPMQLHPYRDSNDLWQLENPACIRCSACIESCPAKILSLLNTRQAAKFRSSVWTAADD